MTGDTKMPMRNTSHRHFCVTLRLVTSTDEVSDLSQASLYLPKDLFVPGQDGFTLFATHLPKLLSGPVDGEFLSVEEFLNYQKLLYISAPVETLIGSSANWPHGFEF